MKKKIEIKDIILLILVLVMLCVNIIIYINKVELHRMEKITDNKSEQRNVDNSISQHESNNEEDIESMPERQRLELYFSKFMDYIENGKYKEAYDLLYPEFKETYFKTLDDFKKYVNETYPNFVSFSYNNIERQGYIYVLMITVINPDLPKDEAKKSQRIVIKENNFNDFVLSFQVI